ncbi:hypothetical protein N7468_003571 [Penicillium chermesinum]|uniref:Uncharacterized protein n=1 Tax=Penicillium chermesinum TaxID=63820 RepID=A0A9W9P6X2_9EURO|nr:uncharacterized protein N7468_003571 [Penicillium chermesinum]KAJ5238952.1 hypothetical protein N7468_003571 [Penicillium chermesinum]
MMILMTIPVFSPGARHLLTHLTSRRKSTDPPSQRGKVIDTEIVSAGAFQGPALPRAGSRDRTSLQVPTGPSPLLFHWEQWDPRGREG